MEAYATLGPYREGHIGQNLLEQNKRGSVAGMPACLLAFAEQPIDADLLAPTSLCPIRYLQPDPAIGRVEKGDILRESDGIAGDKDDLAYSVGQIRQQHVTENMRSSIQFDADITAREAYQAGKRGLRGSRVIVPFEAQDTQSTGTCCGDCQGRVQVSRQTQGDETEVMGIDETYLGRHTT
jgi:hypothetical protein